jgi:hypothetical protein
VKPSVRARARFAVLTLALACGTRAQEPVRPEQPRTETRVATAAVDPRRAPQPQGDPLNLESSAIRGNQELPKVLYIVPWKDPAMAELAGRPVNSLVEEALAPVDREVFRRQTRYFSQLYGAGSSRPAAPLPDGPGAGSSAGSAQGSH